METAKRNIDQLVSTWQRAYQKMSAKDQRKRLEELTTWDHARPDTKDEHTAKVTALKNLLSYGKKS